MHFIMASLSIMALARAAQWTTMVIRVFDEVTQQPLVIGILGSNSNWIFLPILFYY